MKLFIGFIIAAIALCCVYFFSDPLTKEDREAINKAYRAAEASIAQHAEAVSNQVLARKEYSQDVADDMTGWRAAWTCCWDGEEGLQALANEEISEHLISEQWSSEVISKQLKQFVLDLQEVEDKLAKETGCYDLSLAQSKGNERGIGTLGTEPLTLTDAIQKQFFTELVSIIGAEAATQLLVSGGILSTGSAFSASSLGVSLGVALAVDALVRWIMDPSADVKQQLDEALDKAAEEHKKLFSDTLIKILDERRNCWTEEISEYRLNS